MLKGWTVPLIIGGLVLGLSGFIITRPMGTPAISNNPQPTESRTVFPLPIDQAGERVTKKRFGQYVSPGNSTVSPEKFTGYHSGTDFETFPEEEDQEVKINAICTGPITVKRQAQGYGGVVAQDCLINDQGARVIYGHLKLSSVQKDMGETLNSGDLIGFLGDGFSQETDNERKHLHLGIYTGKDNSIRGYLETKEQLQSWLDPALVLGLAASD